MKQAHNPQTEIQDAIGQYVDDAVTEKSEDTVRERKRAFSHFQRIIDKFDLETVEDISPDMIKEHRKARSNIDGVTDRTIKGEITYIAGLCNYFNHTEFQKVYDVKDLELDTTSIVDRSEHVKSLSPEEYKKVLQECNTLRNELVVRVGWDTGARRSEIANIDLNDIEYDEITINTAKKPQSNKSDNKRTVFLSVTTAEKVKEYIKYERDSYGGASSTDALFETQRGRMHPHSLNDIFTTKCSEAGIQKKLTENAKGQEMNLYTYHSLRHSYAVQRLESGMSLKFIADIMGDTVQSVSETYLQTSKEQLREQEKKHRPDIRI